MTITIKEHSFEVNVGHNSEAWQYINSGLWEPHTFRILDHFVKDDTIVMDIGAWSGVVSLYAAHIAQKVYAIDPDPICYKELESNLALNPVLAKKIVPKQLAISDKKGSTPLSARNSYGQSSSSILYRSRDSETSFTTPMISLTDFINNEQIEKIDFIKIDIEGAEFKILPTIDEFLKRTNYPTLYISFHYYHLLEYICGKTFTSKIINKILLKIERTTGINLFSKVLSKTILNSFMYLEPYKYIYTTDGTLIDIDVLKEQPTFIKDHDLVFTNQEWH